MDDILIRVGDEDPGCVVDRRPERFQQETFPLSISSDFPLERPPFIENLYLGALNSRRRCLEVGYDDFPGRFIDRQGSRKPELPVVVPCSAERERVCSVGAVDFNRIPFGVGHIDVSGIFYGYRGGKLELAVPRSEFVKEIQSAVIDLDVFPPRVTDVYFSSGIYENPRRFLQPCQFLDEIPACVENAKPVIA